MKKFLVLVFFFVFSVFSPLSAQQVDRDSLLQVIAVAKENASKAKTLLALGTSYRESNPDSTILYTQQALLLSRKIGYSSGECNALNDLGYIAMQKGDYPTALDLYLKALKISKSFHLDSISVSVYNRIGLTYYYMDDYGKAINYLLKAKETLNKTPFKLVESNTLGNLARAYLRKGMFDSALYYGQQAYKSAIKNDYRIYVGVYLNTLGEIHTSLGDDDKGMALMRQGVIKSTELNNIRSLLLGLLSIAKVYQKKGLLDSAIIYNHKALVIAKRNKYSNHIFEAASLLSNIYHTKEQQDSAFYYLKLATEARNEMYSQEKIGRLSSRAFNEQLQQQEIEAATIRYQSKIRIFVLLGGLAVLGLISTLLYRNNKQKQRAYEELQKQKEETDHQKAKTDQALAELKITQSQLVQREKMAALGELTAGIAHEIQNPLNFVNNFSEVSAELVQELRQEEDKKLPDKVLLSELLANIELNLSKIQYHGKRADSIVKGMLEHSRASSGEKQLTDINALAEEYLQLSYHGLRDKDKNFNVTFKTDFDESIGKVEVAPKDMGRVLINLFNNAFYALNEKKKQLNGSFEPTVEVSTRKFANKIWLSVKDNGTGIPHQVLNKIFQPFFTTKPTGQGSGLGLSLSYDIITKGHRGELKVETKEGEYTEMIVQLSLHV